MKIRAAQMFKFNNRENGFTPKMYATRNYYVIHHRRQYNGKVSVLFRDPRLFQHTWKSMETEGPFIKVPIECVSQVFRKTRKTVSEIRSTVLYCTV